MSGDYRQDTLALLNNLTSVIELADDSPERLPAEEQARKQINEYTALYRRSDQVAGSRSFMAMQTALSGLAGHYSAYPNRPVPEKLKKRLSKEFKQVEMALNRGS